MCLKKKKRDREEESPKLLKRSLSERSLTDRSLLRTNSVKNLSGLILDNSSRNAVQPDNNLKKEDFQDFSVIGVYSRENSHAFGKKWLEQQFHDTSNQLTKTSLNNVNDYNRKETDNLLSKQLRALVKDGIQNEVKTLFENKNIPHVMVVIEGKEEESDLTLSTKGANKEDIDLTYSSKLSVKGYTKKIKKDGTLSKDGKQNMQVYVRDDMKSAYSISNEEIPHSNGGKIKAIGINYRTEDGTNYRTLAVHIPHEFVGSKSENNTTHEEFEEYAKNTLESENVIVTGYLGDTNYGNPIYKNAVPSLGGQFADGNTLNPQSSTAKEETNFIQHVPLGKFEKTQKHSVLQPSALNYIFRGINKEVSTDHPSMIGRTAHLSKIVGRDPEANSNYYEGTAMEEFI